MISQSILTISRRVTEAVASYWTDVGIKVKNDVTGAGNHHQAADGCVTSICTPRMSRAWIRTS